jgi:murein DD-endopeptidase MepM/ murein hydrolase activator NlpD
MIVAAGPRALRETPDAGEAVTMKPASIALAGLLAVFSTGADACETGGRLQHPAQGEIYRKFGYTAHPLLKAVRLHAGLDYRGAGGEPVSAAEAGTVVIADRFNEETNGEAGYGNYVRIDRGNGLQTAYAHLLNFNVKAGQCVSKGEVIGRLGNSGLSSEPYLHLEVIQNGQFADPSPLLPDRS